MKGRRARDQRIARGIIEVRGQAHAETMIDGKETATARIGRGGSLDMTVKSAKALDEVIIDRGGMKNMKAVTLETSAGHMIGPIIVHQVPLRTSCRLDQSVMTVAMGTGGHRLTCTTILHQQRPRAIPILLRYASASIHLPLETVTRMARLHHTGQIHPYPVCRLSLLSMVHFVVRQGTWNEGERSERTRLSPYGLRLPRDHIAMTSE